MVRIVGWNPTNAVGIKRSLSQLAASEEAEIGIAVSNKTLNLYDTNIYCVKNARTALYVDNRLEGKTISNYSDVDFMAMEIMIESGTDCHKTCIVSCKVECNYLDWADLALKLNDLNDYRMHNDIEMLIVAKMEEVELNVQFKKWTENRKMHFKAVKNENEENYLTIVTSKNLQEFTGKIGMKYNMVWGNYFVVDIWKSFSGAGIKVLQLNAGKRTEAFNEIAIQAGTKEIDIALLQEPPRLIGKTRDIGNGNTYCGDTIQEVARASIWISKNLDPDKNAFYIYDLSDRDTTVVELRMRQNKGSYKKIILCSIYMPLKDKEGNEIQNPAGNKLTKIVEYAQANNRDLLIGTDSNAHHNNWGDKNNDV